MHLRLFPTVEAPSRARREIASLSTCIDESSVSGVSTVVSELVAISVANGASKPIEVSLAIEDDALECVVRDDGPGARALERARSRRDDSLVLRIVDGLVEDWEANAGEGRIWFRMAVRPV